MWRLVPTLVAEMGQAYPELVRAAAAHRRNAASRRDALSRDARARSRDPRRGDRGARPGRQAFRRNVAFKLYDTYGFPLDLTQDALRARGIGVDKEVFDAAMERQRAEARKAWAGSGEIATEAFWFALKERLGATEFLGYETERSEGVVAAILHDGGEAFSLKARRARGADPQSDALLWRIGRTGRRRRRDARQRRALPRREHTQEARRSHRS